MTDKSKDQQCSSKSTNNKEGLYWTSPVMASFLKANNDSYKQPYVSDFILKYENKLSQLYNIAPNKNKCVVCSIREPISLANISKHSWAVDTNGYLLGILCQPCYQKMQNANKPPGKHDKYDTNSKDFNPALYRRAWNPPLYISSTTTGGGVVETEMIVDVSEIGHDCIDNNNDGDDDDIEFDHDDQHTQVVELVNSDLSSPSKRKSFEQDDLPLDIVDDETDLSLLWTEVRNAIIHIFFQEGFILNEVSSIYIYPPLLSAYVMPSNTMLRLYVTRLFNCNKRRLFLLTVCNVHLFILEIKLRMLKELMRVQPYCIFPAFLALFERLLRVLHRINLFLDVIEHDFFKENKLHWFGIHMLFFQSVVYMNRFVQRSISYLCDCATDIGLKTDDDQMSQAAGKMVYQSYVILEQNMTSFSLYANSHASNFAVFFTRFDEFQMLFQLAILLFKCRNFDEGIFSKRFTDPEFEIKNLEDMPYLDKNMLIKDAINTSMFQQFLLIHHWNSTDIFEHALKELLQLSNMKVSLSLVKSVLIDSFTQAHFNEPSFLRDFFTFIEQDMPENCYLEELLGQEIVLTDEEDDEESALFAQNAHSYSHYFPLGGGGVGKWDCQCRPGTHCTCRGDSRFVNTTRTNWEMRDRLRYRLTQRKVSKHLDGNSQQKATIDQSIMEQTVVNNQVVDERDLDDLLKFINGTNNNNNNNNEEKKEKKSKKKKNKHNEQSQHNHVVINGGQHHRTEMKRCTTEHQQQKHQQHNQQIIEAVSKIQNDHCIEAIEMVRLEHINTEISTSLSKESQSNKPLLVSNMVDIAEDGNNKTKKKKTKRHKNKYRAQLNEHYSSDVDKHMLSGEQSEHQQHQPTVLHCEQQMDQDNNNDQIQSTNQSLELLDDVFKPKDINFDDEDLDEFEKELEMFKRFCYNNSTGSSSACKPKLCINVKEIFTKRV